ncbi:Beta-1,3-glucan-binding protein [Frankliniella fusca]|uniref:Beta-1,3-glucan-binding protein n=1 Tax=Frankliniella fusca TaxID=407009 RepID=A0AAE1GU75_9NEOP|nr:Beta-1,3-glucan-binding protein [Frankliniella fusca]
MKRSRSIHSFSSLSRGFCAGKYGQFFPVLSHSETFAAAEKLVFNDDFDTLDERKWVHMVSAWRGGRDQFQYYRNSRKNRQAQAFQCCTHSLKLTVNLTERRKVTSMLFLCYSYVRNGILYLKPTLTADEFGEDFVQHGKLSYPDCNFSPCLSTPGPPLHCTHFPKSQQVPVLNKKPFCSESGKDIVLPVQSARISTYDLFSFKYGRLEVRAKLPKGDWLWPAIWLFPQVEVYGAWPRSGEIDLVRSRGNTKLFDAQGKQDGIRRVSSILHFGPAYDEISYHKSTYTKDMGSDTLADDFHVYTLDWSEAGFRFLLDGQLIGERPAPKEGFWKLGGFQGKDIWHGKKMAPFDQKFFIIMHLAVGGSYLGDDLRNEPHPRPFNLSSGRAMSQFWERKDWWKDTWKGESAALQVDYVRVYQ